MTFFTAGTYGGGLVFIGGGLLALRAGTDPGIAFLEGLVGFGLMLLFGYVAELFVMSGPLVAEQGVERGPLIRTMTALTSATPGGPETTDEELELHDEERLAA